MSRNGTTIGGWLTMRCLPSTTSASLESACRLSRVCALAAICLAALPPALAAFFFALPFWALSAVFMAASSSSSERWAYQMSMVRIAANSAIAVR